MYESIAAFTGAKPVPLPLREENEFRIDPAELERLITPRTKLLILNSPHNPCGSALTKADCEAIAEIAMRHDLTVLTDEVYWAIRYDGGHASVLDVDGMAERTILLDGWSKTFAMTGWRLGFGVLPPALVEPVTRLIINSVSCTSAFSQHAARAALEGPWEPVERMVAEFRARRDLIVDLLNKIPGVSCQTPQGAFYVFPKVTELGLPAATLQAPADERGRGGGPARHRVRQLGRGLPATVLRELGREPARRRRRDRRHGHDHVIRTPASPSGTPRASWPHD